MVMLTSKSVLNKVVVSDDVSLPVLVLDVPRRLRARCLAEMVLENQKGRKKRRNDSMVDEQCKDWTLMEGREGLQVDFA